MELGKSSAACILSSGDVKLRLTSHEVGVDLLGCLSTVAAKQVADCSIKIWAHLLCDPDDYEMPDLS